MGLWKELEMEPHEEFEQQVATGDIRVFVLSSENLTRLHKFYAEVLAYSVLCTYCIIIIIIIIIKYGSTLYIGMDEVFQHHAHTFEKSDLNFHFQCELSSVDTEW